MAQKTNQESSLTSDTPKVENSNPPEQKTEEAVKEENSGSSNVNETPNAGENPVMGGFLERFIAHLIDVIIVGIAGFIIGLLLGLFVYLPVSLLDGVGGGDFKTTYDTLNYSFSNVVGIILGFLYYGYFYTKNGQTPGKKIMSLKVVKADSLRYLNWGEVFIRDVIGKLVSGFVFLLGYFWYFMSEKRQTWHDKFAGSYVVKTDEKGEVLKDGPEEYPKEPVKTFLPCGCFGLIFISASVLMIIAATQVLNSIPESYQNQSPTSPSEFTLPEDSDNTQEFDPEEFEEEFNRQMEQFQQETETN